MDDPSARAFEAASRHFVGLVASVPDDRWAAPALGTWTVKELVAHANRAHTTVVDYTERPQPPAAPGSDYFSSASIEARAREAVAALGDDPSAVRATVAAASRTAVDLVGRCPPDTVLGTPAGAVPLAVYVPSRVAELAVHGLDLSRALGGDGPVLPAEVLEEALVFVARRAARGAGAEVLLALTGRGDLPDGFNVY
jgi:uncharacterized protein (TIGR03083 family)